MCTCYFLHWESIWPCQSKLNMLNHSSWIDVDAILTTLPCLTPLTTLAHVCWRGATGLWRSCCSCFQPQGREGLGLLALSPNPKNTQEHVRPTPKSQTQITFIFADFNCKSFQVVRRLAN